MDPISAVLLGALHLLPRPRSVAMRSCARPFAFARPLRIGAQFDPGAAQEIDERWRALGMPQLVRSQHPNIVVIHAAMPPQSYELETDGSTVTIRAGDADGAFYAAMTLAQLPVRQGAHWVLPCVRISDAPALRWRILSDDVSRGPLPNMRYFEERIRTIAAFKMNGYSPYMESVFVDPHDPLPAPLDGITPKQLHELARYAARFHVAFIPEQQTFAHMHNTLRLEKYASAAELPHGFLLSPASPISVPYVRQLIDDELAAVGHPPFFHIGSDETSTLGLGQSKALVRKRGLAQVYAQHIREMDRIIAPSGARVMLWDDGVENDPAIMRYLPRNAVLINWHYGSQRTFMPQIDLLKKGGFDQMVAPGDSNWNQIFPDVKTAIANEGRFIDEGKQAHVLGLFQTVWNDDGQTLFEATWYPVLYAASSAWEQGHVDSHRFAADFPAAFFGVDDPGYSRDIADLADIQSRIAGMYEYTSDYLFAVDAFDPGARAHMRSVDLHTVRLEAEDAEQHLLLHPPPLHANAARVMFLAAREYDFIGRKFQAAREIRRMWAAGDARDVLWCKYWFWELRDGYEGLAPLYAQAWRYEDRASHLQGNLELYHLGAQRNIERAERIEAATLAEQPGKPLPPLDDILYGR